MCDALKKELEAGATIATALANHLDRMGAARAVIPFAVSGANYEVIIERKTGVSQIVDLTRVKLWCENCKAPAQSKRRDGGDICCDKCDFIIATIHA